jgi:hypothetical protein
MAWAALAYGCAGMLRLIHSNMHEVLVGTGPHDVLDRAVVVKWAQGDKVSFRDVLRAIRGQILPAVRGLRGAGAPTAVVQQGHPDE